MTKQSILLIEDNMALRQGTAELLELAGYAVIEAENGKKALEVLAKQEYPDLVLCDIMMPELDGYGVLKAIQNIKEMAGVPFIFTTAKVEAKDLRLGMNLGADDYLIKPFTNNDLLNIVSIRLEKSAGLKELGKKDTNKIMEFINDNTSYADIFSLSQHKISKKLMAKQMVYLEGDTVNSMYYLVKGKIKVFKANEDGKELIINIYKEGELFGHLSLLEEYERESAMAIEDAEILYIPREEFLQIVSSKNEFAMRVIKSISTDMAEAAENMLRLAYNSGRKRVADALLSYFKKYKENGKDNFAIARGDVSAIAGISKESVSRTLSDFKEEGLIEIGDSNGNIKIQDSKKLEKVRN